MKSRLKSQEKKPVKINEVLTKILSGTVINYYNIVSIFHYLSGDGNVIS